jgi:membrane protease subunit HflK
MTNHSKRGIKPLISSRNQIVIFKSKKMERFMAWNEPGGGRNNNQDPWRNGGGNNEGPPDLDEVMKKLQERFGGLFGGGKGGNNSGGSNSGGTGLLVVALVIGLLFWIGSGVYRVEEAEKAVVLRFGKFHNIVSAGLHWKPTFIDEILKVNTKQVYSHRHEASMLTEDQNIVDVQLEVQYLVDDPQKYYLEVADARSSLRQATESSLRHVVGSKPMDLVITEGREIIAIEVKGRLQEYLNRYNTGLYINKVNVQDAHPPKEVKASFDDVIKAKEDKERLKNEAEAYANGIVPEARGMARRQLEEANAYKSEVVSKAEGEADRFKRLLVEYEKAPEVTRQRLYIDAMESVFSNSTKVMVDVEGGNNMLYLPLDKIMEMQNKSSDSRGAVSQISSSTRDNSVGLDRLRQRSDVRSAPIREGR